MKQMLSCCIVIVLMAIGCSATDPVEPAGPRKPVDLKIGVMPCLLISDGVVMCWGLNDEEQYIAHELEDVKAPTPVPGLPPVQSLAIGSFAMCVAATGRTLCWGKNLTGSVGTGQGDGEPTPVPILRSGRDAFLPTTRVWAGGGTSCDQKISGAINCWGSDTGDGSGVATSIPTPLRVTGAQEMALGAGAVCAIDKAGDAWCWGSNFDGELGDGTTQGRTWPRRIPELSNVVKIAPASTMCAIVESGDVWCWGDNANGGVGNGRVSKTPEHPQRVEGLNDVNDVATTNGAACAVLKGGAVKCWGENFAGEVGDGSFHDRYRPVDVALSDIVKIGGQGFLFCALRRDGAVFCWGEGLADVFGSRGEFFNHPIEIDWRSGLREFRPDVATVE